MRDGHLGYLDGVENLLEPVQFWLVAVADSVLTVLLLLLARLLQIRELTAPEERFKYVTFSNIFAENFSPGTVKMEIT